MQTTLWGDYHIAGTICGRKFHNFINKRNFCDCSFTIPSNLGNCNAFPGARASNTYILSLLPGMPSVTPNINDGRVHNAAELTDDLSFPYQTNVVPFLFQKLGCVGFLFCNSSAYLAFQVLTVPSFSWMSHSLLQYTPTSLFHRISSNFSTLQLLGLRKHLIQAALLLSVLRTI